MWSPHPQPRLLTVNLIESASGLRESLSSYLLRLAETNCVLPASLLNYIIHDEDGFPKNEGRGNLAPCFQSIIRATDRSLKLLGGLERRTGSKKLIQGTSHPFAPICTNVGRLRSFLGWSPMAFLRQPIQYYPLLWHLAPVRVCISSRLPLRSVCVCGAQLMFQRGPFKIGYCPVCGIDLERAAKLRPNPDDPLFSSIRSLDYEFWLAEQISDFLKYTYSSGLSADFQMGVVLRWWFDLFEFAKRPEIRAHMDVSLVIGESWTENRYKPTLRKLLHLCYLCRVSLLDFLHCRAGARHPGTLAEPIPGEEGYLKCAPVRRAIDQKAVGRRLQLIISKNHYPLYNFRQICRELLHIRPSQIYKAHPDKSKALGVRFLETKHMLALKKRESFIAEMRIVAEYLWTRGITPHHKSLTPYISKPSNLRCLWAMAALKTIRKELRIVAKS